jgi:serine phosphatase RsbU (regulator of sigma subunit)
LQVQPPPEPFAAALRHWLTGTFGGRALIAGAVLKAVALAAAALSTSRLISTLDTVADLTLLVGVLLAIRHLVTDARGQLLWRVRRKLTLSYIFIGFVPVLLIIVFFLVSGLILFLNVSQYVAASRVDAIVAQAAFLADSAAIGLEGADTVGEIRERLARRQAGAAPMYPYVSYAAVPVPDCATAAAPTVPDASIAVGPWGHAEAPPMLPDWIGCEPVNGLVAYAEVSRNQLSEPSIPAHLAARAIAWPQSPGGGYAVVVDLPLSAQLLATMRADTGIDYGLGDISVVRPDPERPEQDTGGPPPACTGLPIVGRSLDAGVTVPAPPAASRFGNPFSRPITWVTFLPYLDWERGDSCKASIRIRMTLGDLYARISSTSETWRDRRSSESVGLAELIRSNPTFALVAILALVGVLFLLIQIVAFIMGLALARSITGSVHQIFAGTERVRLGDFTQTIPITSRDQLGELAESFNSMTRSIADLLQQKAEKERMEQELRIARSIQMSLLPRDPVTLPGFAVTAHCEPAREVGGDYYDYMSVGEQQLGLLIADVAGKGTSAALYMAELKGLMLSLSQLHTSPRQLLIDANRILSKHLDSKSFITITYAVVDAARRTLTYARAGHCPLIYVPGPYAASRAAQVLAPDGLVLGLQIDDGGERFIRLLEEVTIPLGTGDLFLFYTDGLTDAMDPDGNCFGDPRLAAVVQEHADAPFDELRDTILREIAIFAGPAAQHDDMTMLLLRVEEVGTASAALSGPAVTPRT